MSAEVRKKHSILEGELGRRQVGRARVLDKPTLMGEKVDRTRNFPGIK